MQAGVVVGDRQVAANANRVSTRIGDGIAVENVLKGDTRPLDLAACLAVVFGDQQVATVALSTARVELIGQVRFAHAAHFRRLHLLCEHALDRIGELFDVGYCIKSLLQRERNQKFEIIVNVTKWQVHWGCAPYAERGMDESRRAAS